MFDLKNKSHVRALLVISIFSFMLAGCSVGPKFLKDGHLGYNESVKVAADRELLLNIVRLRYLDTIEFLAANSISAQTAMTVKLGAELGADGGDGISLVMPEMEYSDKPTITFTPQRSKDFARRLTAPVEVEILAYLATSGWPIHYLFLLFGTELNGIDNSPGSSFEEYNKVAQQMRQLQLDGKLLVGFIEKNKILSAPIDAEKLSADDYLAAAKEGYQFSEETKDGNLYLVQKTAQPVVWVKTDGGAADTLKNSMRIAPLSKPPFFIQQGSGFYRKNIPHESIVLRTRSLLGSIAYLSQAVELPPEHKRQKIAPEPWPYQQEGNSSLSPIFAIRSSKENPQTPLSVLYRGYWFYIDETDMSSKTAFLIIAEIYRLAIIEGGAGQVPVLTLPVGG